MNTVERLLNKPKRVLHIQTLEIPLKSINHSQASFFQTKLEPHSTLANPNSYFFTINKLEQKVPLYCKRWCLGVAS